MEIKEVIIEKVVEVEKLVGDEGEQGDVAMVEALKEELRERDVEVQRLRKKVKAVERELDSRNYDYDENTHRWTKLKPSDRRSGAGHRDNAWESARLKSSRAVGNIDIDRGFDDIRRAEQLERAFGAISDKLVGITR